MMTIIVAAEKIETLQDALALEWLETNGTGGYASSSILNCHTRKYHGLLVTNLPPPVNGRHVLLSKFEQSVITSGEHEQFLSLHEFAGEAEFSTHNVPLRRFSLDLYPSWEYELAEGHLRIELLMPHRRNCLLMRYTLFGCSWARLHLKPLLAYRRNHTTAAAHPHVNQTVNKCEGGYILKPYDGMPSLYLTGTDASSSWRSDFHWYNDFAYSMERKRGYGYFEDLMAPGTWEMTLEAENPLLLAVAADERIDNVVALWEEEVSARRRRGAEVQKRLAQKEIALSEKELVAGLSRAAGQFLIWVPPKRHSVIAGYHWFDDWGRDSLISLPGLTFCSALLEDGFEVLCSFAQFEDNGLIPNYIGMEGKPAYNSLDAALWFFWTIQQYLYFGGSPDRVRDVLWPTMKRIVERMCAGTAPAVQVTEQGLLQAGHAEISLTWMDAIVDGVPVTPRAGMAVDINALWFNALHFAAALAERFRDREFSLSVDLAQLKDAFLETFWLSERGYLADVVNAGVQDTSVRPNQLLAIALPYSPLNSAQARAVVDIAEAELLTPVGLRTLSCKDSLYRGRYEGSQAERDNSYHQGTVWPWLLGFFGEAYLKTHSDKKAACQFLRQRLLHWHEHLHEAGLGQVSEVFDGDPPHRPNGCIAQAWSVAEILRLFTIIWEVEK